MLKPFSKYNKGEILNLKNKLKHYYDNIKDYSAFKTISNHTLQWDLIKKDIVKKKGKIRILEVGAGRTGFSSYLKKNKLKNKVFFYAHDITSQNSHFLKKNSNKVILGDLNKNKIKNKFEIIFLTHVLEHVVEPKKLLDRIYNLLDKRGSVYIFCPRYDFILYLSPSSRHLSLYKKINLILLRLFYRVSRLMTGKPNFLIHNDIAAFYINKFFTDCDAIHWVSKKDIEYWANSKKLKIKSFNFGQYTNKISKDYIVKKFLTISFKLTKN